MKSETTIAREIQAYFLAAGVAAAANIIAEQETGHPVRSRSRSPPYVGGNVAQALDVTVGDVFGPSESR
jgi:hypothetical protein